MSAENTVDPDIAHADDYRPPIPDTSHLITETDEPVDNIFSEKQMRLLTEPLYASWNPGRSFWVAANVGMYEALNANAVVPDVLLSLDTGPDQAKEYGSKCYFFWDHGKPPEVVIEIVSNKTGNELGSKMERYAKLRVDHYVVFDPTLQLSEEPLQAFLLQEGEYRKRSFEGKVSSVKGLSLTLWQGSCEGQEETWLRWVDERTDEVVATGTERADAEAKRADLLAAKLREMGVDPDDI